MNKFVDDKGLKRYTDNMKLLLKKKVSKKRPYGQIVIGKSINPKSYDWGTIYAFRGKPTITIWSNNKEEAFTIYIRRNGVMDKGTQYHSIGLDGVGKGSDKYSHFIHITGYQKTVCGFRIDNSYPYTDGDTNIYLEKVDIPSSNLTGTSTKYSWNNGKRVTSRKGTFEMACEILRYKFINDIAMEANVSIIKAYRLNKGGFGVPYWMHSVFRGKPYRDKNPNKKKKYTRFTRKSPRRTSLLGGGLWLVRFYDRRCKTYMNDVKVYVRKTKEGKLIFKRT